MSYMKRTIEDLITYLSQETGHDEEFLYERYDGCMSDVDDEHPLGHFIEVTLERDWDPDDENLIWPKDEQSFLSSLFNALSIVTGYTVAFLGKRYHELLSTRSIKNYHSFTDLALDHAIL